jgi:flagellar export protein FliJ
MKAFKFALQRVLDLRDARVEEEERKVAELQRELAKLEIELELLARSRNEASKPMSTGAESRGEELRAITRFQARLERLRVSLTQKRDTCSEKLKKQRESFREARREQRLLETLRDKQQAEWNREAGREVDKVAGELFLARWEAGKQRDARTRSEK